MAAQNVDTFVIGFSDPAIPNPDPIRSRVNVSQAFDLSINNVVTLSTNTANGNDDIAGLLYVPTLSPTDPCANASKQYVPNNVTRLENLPPTQYQYKYTAFAPWFSAECTKSYLAAIVPPNIITSFIFYQPSSNTDASPPGPSDPTWGLQDGGSWKKNNPFPVYAIPGSNGAFFMQQLAQYSGNTSQAPNSDLLSKEFSPSDYIRVFSTFTTASGTSLPTLWAFLLIVLGVVLVLVAITSFAMHFIQRRARRDLQRRLQNGEVPLEWLGIKAPRMTQEDVDALPLGPYIPNENKPTLPLNDNSESTTAPASPQKGSTAQQKDGTIQPPPSAATSPQDYNQPTCPICLEDYIPHSTRVRSLPCHHIYHPDCIDRYLLRTSSLCPICKTKVVPPSHGIGRVALPRINNTMVRRERYARRLAQRTDQPSGGGNGYGEPQSLVPFSGSGGFRRWVRRVPGVGFVGTALLAREPNPSTAATAGEGPQRRQQPTESQIEMGAIGSSSRPNQRPFAGTAAAADNAAPSSPNGAAAEQNNAAAPVPDAPPPADAESRREWARRRASALLGRHPGPNDNDDSAAVADQITAAEPDEARRPGWRKAVGKAFPGFR
ncbi:MAG: hypothetical protein OHK93_001547 [Ramalina farinacea]|uniref:RING-type domain-containing protein n=1 Tax=Ramalina farinacea TaxID=258253 RepID=A0AA43QPT2_9LECA|nr:hypothetical protein [Ramalina farinacea]